MNRLNKEIEGIKGRSAKGLIEAAILIRRETELTPPFTPVDTGNLRSSWFIVTAFGKHPKDSFNREFVDKKQKGLAAKMKTDHAKAIEEAKATMKAKSASGVFLMMGYSANYAAAVHEKIKAKFKKIGADAKWFQSHLQSNTKEIVKIIQENAQIK